ncbi:MAG: hypothetical protein KC416_17090, partial [Myxococcales bacterium]|nr:hypothetical protein [Myxococcales bacterium]
VVLLVDALLRADRTDQALTTAKRLEKADDPTGQNTRRLAHLLVPHLLHVGDFDGAHRWAAGAGSSELAAQVAQRQTRVRLHRWAAWSLALFTAALLLGAAYRVRKRQVTAPRPGLVSIAVVLFAGPVLIAFLRDPETFDTLALWAVGGSLLLALQTLGSPRRGPLGRAYLSAILGASAQGIWGLWILTREGALFGLL